jgi:hypothetical protein
MRKLACAIVALGCLWGGAARADRGPFGLGLVVGSPTGLSMKLYLSDRTAVDAALGGALIGDQGIHVHGDYLYHPFVLHQDESFALPAYIGIGVRLLSHDHGGGDSDDGLHVGLRAPVGVLFDFSAVPLDVFVEVALVVDILTGHSQDAFGGIDLNAGIGVRYYF